MIFFYIVFIFVISPLCLHLPDRIPTADSSENYSGQAGVLHFDNFYFPSENNTTVNINSMKSSVATFSSLFPRVERRCESNFLWPVKAVSIHVPARGTTVGTMDMDEVKKFQSTFPRGERLARAAQLERRQGVSIHVPARGTTYFQRNNIIYIDVSIHVPARGTTWYVSLDMVR